MRWAARWRIATDEAGIQFRTLNSSKGPAVRATRAQADRAAVQGGDPPAPGKPAQSHDVPAGGRRPAARRRPRRRREDPARHRVQRPRGGADHRHLPRRPGARGAGKLPGRAHGRSARGVARRAPARTEPAGGPAEDRHPAAHRRPQHRLQPDPGAAGRRPGAGVLLHGRCGHAPRAAPVLDHAYHRGNARDHPRRARPLADVHRRHRRGGAALLPVDRGQDHPLCRQGQPPDLPRAGGADHPRNLPQRHLDLAAVRRAAGHRALDPRAGKRAHPAPRLRHRIRLLRPAQPQGLARNQVDRRPVLCRADQRHHRLRRGRRAGPAGRHQRGACRCRAKTPGARVGTRPTSVCWSTT